MCVCSSSTCTCTCMCTCVCVHQTPVHVHVCVYMYMYVYMYIMCFHQTPCTWVHVCVCVFIKHPVHVDLHICQTPCTWVHVCVCVFIKHPVHVDLHICQTPRTCRSTYMSNTLYQTHLCACNYLFSYTCTLYIPSSLISPWDPGTYTGPSMGTSMGPSTGHTFVLPLYLPTFFDIPLRSPAAPHPQVGRGAHLCWAETGRGAGEGLQVHVPRG